MYAYRSAAAASRKAGVTSSLERRHLHSEAMERMTRVSTDEHMLQ